MLRGVLGATVALCGCDTVLGLQHVPPPGGDSPRAIVFDNSSATSDLAGFPVLVPLGPNDLDYVVVADPSHDLRFHDERTATDLPFEIERWDPTGESDLWVRVPIIHAGSTTDRILMFYGEAAAGQQAPAAVWADYDLVFHGGNLVDSSGHVVPKVETPTAPATAPGIVGEAVQFAGTEQRIWMTGGEAMLSNWDTYTVELWLQPQFDPDPPNFGLRPGSTTQGAEPAVIDKPGGALEGGRLRNTVTNSPSPFNIQTDLLWEGQTTLNAIFYVPNLDWSYIVFAYDHQYLWTYRDGVALDVHGNDALAPSANDSSGILDIGPHETPLFAAIDELRVSTRYRDRSWLFAQYLAMTRHFVTVTDP